MASLNLPNTIDANTTADALEVQQNFDVVESYVNNDVIRRDGAVAMNAPLTLAGDPTTDNQAANKGYVDVLMPVGTIMMFAGNSAPTGAWRLCNGASMPVASFPELYAVLGVRYGGAGGTFNLPNFAARVPIGMDTAQTRFSATGKTGGNTLVPVPSHVHEIDHDHGSATSGAASDSSFTTTTTGSAHIHTGEYTAHAIPAPGSGYWIARRTADTGTSAANITPSGGAHTHTVSTPHTHAVNLPAFNGNSKAYIREINLNLATGGVANAPVTNTSTEHIPPFVVVNYIIRVDS